MRGARSMKPLCALAARWAGRTVGVVFVAATYACASSEAVSSSFGAERFSACPKATGEAWGAVENGGECTDASDCNVVCCLCPRGGSQYAYAACKDHRCASHCDPVNDTRAPVCDGAGGDPSDCWRCAHVLNVALADAEDEGASSCPGAAEAAWSALRSCVASSCGPDCPRLGPDAACLACVNRGSEAGGCAAELDTCRSQ